MRFYIIAGEASGDLIGGLLIKALKKQNPNAEIYAWGGQKMEAAGANIRKHYRELAFMGFAEVVKHLPEIMKNFSFCKLDITEFNPEAIIFIDYPGFNMRMAHWAKKQSVQKKWKTIYYVAPQAWAWKERRVYALKRDVDLMLCILPFEKDFFARFDLQVEFVGHPLLDVIDEFKTQNAKGNVQNANLKKELSKPYIALLPGSRKQEIEKNLSIMLGAAALLPQFNFIIAAAANQPQFLYDKIIHSFQSKTHLTEQTIKIVQNDTYTVLNSAHLAAVKSGTSTLETALFGVPQVVCYRAGKISYEIAKRIIKVPYIALANLVSGKKIVEELIQNDFTPTILAQKLLEAEKNKAQILTDYTELRKKLGIHGASERAATIIISFVNPK